MGKLDSILLFGAVALAGCSGGPSSNADEMLGEAVLAVTNAPADAGCLKVSVVGTRTVTRLFNLMPGQNTVFDLNGLPLGADTFQEDAFASGCAAVGPMSVATWTSDPVVATLVAGVAANVTVVLRRNGTAVVSSDFQDDPMCTPTGGACMAASSCCSGNTCNAGVCTSSMCMPPQQLCMTPMGTACVDVSSNVNNCGSCSTVCSAGANANPVCAMGTCSLTCNPGFQNCDGNPANGCESAIFSDPMHCGSCGTACPPMFSCVMGACLAPPPQIQVPSVLSFPVIPVGSSTLLPLQIQNTGGSPLFVSGSMVSGPAAADYQMQPPGGFSVPPGMPFTANVIFSALGGGLQQANLFIQSNDPMRPSVQVQLIGNGF